MRTLKLQITRIGGGGAQIRKHTLSAKPMILTNTQVPISMVPSGDGPIAELLCKRVGQKNGIGKGYTLTKMKQTNCFCHYHSVPPDSSLPTL